MPNILSIPRELRDDIYKWILKGPLHSRSASESSKRSRKRISKPKANDFIEDSIDNNARTGESTNNTSMPEAAAISNPANDSSTILTNADQDAGYYDGEESVRYPEALPLPPTEPLLNSTRQLRDEMLDTLSRKRLRYKIRLAFRDDTDIIYPTWISVPALSHHVDVLDVELRISRGKTTSLMSAYGDDDDKLEREGDVFFGGLVLLRRFLERGVSFLSKKKAQKITVRLLALNITDKDLKSRWTEETEPFEEITHFLDDWLTGRTQGDVARDELERQDELLGLFAERIDRFSCQIGDKKREWDVKEAVAERQERSREREREQEAERLADADR